MKKALIGIFLFLMFSLTAIHFGISPLAEKIIESKSEELLGRKIEIDKLKINIFQGRVEIDEFKLNEENSVDNFVSFESFNFDIAMLKLLSKEIAFDYITLSQPSVSIIKDNDIFNFSDMIKSDNKKPKESKAIKDESKKEKGFALKVDKFSIDSFTINYEDINTNLEINETIDNISYNNIYISNTLSLNMNIEIKDMFNLSFDVKNQADELNIVLNLNKIDVSYFNKYIGDYVNLSSTQGNFNGQYNIGISKDSLSINGYIAGTDIKVNDLDNRTIAGIEALDIKLENFDLKNKKLLISSINFNKPYAYIELSKNGINLQHIVKNSPTEDKETDEKKAKENETDKQPKESFSFEINSIELSNGIIEFKDISKEDSFDYKLDKLNINAENISDSMENIKISIDSNLNNEQAKLALKSDIKSPKLINGELNISNFKLGEFNHYIKEFININELNGIYSSNLNFELNLNEEISVNANMQNSIKEVTIVDSNSINILDFEELKLDIEEFDLKNKKLIISSINFNKPYAYIELSKNGINLQNIVKNSSTEDKETDEEKAKESETDKQPKESFSFKISSIELSNGIIEFKDISKEDSFDYKLDKLNINAENISDSMENIKISIDSNLNNEQAKLALKSDIKSPKLINGELNISNFQLGEFNHYIKEFININEVNGIYSSNLNFELNLLNEEISVDANMQNSIKKFTLVDSKSINILDFEELKLNIEEFDLANKDITVSLLSIDSLNSNVYFAKNASILDIIPKKEASEEQDKSSEDNSFNYLVKEIKINDSNIIYSDENYAEKFEYELSDIDLSMSNLSNLKTKNGYYNLSIDLNRTGNLNSNGSFNLSENLKLDVKSEINDFDIRDLDIILEKYSPITFSNGIISYKGNSKIDDDKLNLENDISLKSMEILKEKKNILGLNVPLNLALTLLEDENSEIKLSIPIEGDLSNPELDISNLVLTTVKGTLIKTIKSPLKILKVFSQDKEDENNMIKLDYGKNWKTAEFNDYIEKLKSILEKKKKIKAEMLFYNNYEKNSELLAIEELKNRYKQDKLLAETANVTDTDEAFINYINNLAGEENSSLDIAEKSEIILGNEKLNTLITNSKNSKKEFINSYFDRNEKLKVIFVEKEKITEKDKFPHIEINLSVD